TGLPKASCRCAPRCARPRRCSPAIATSLPRSTRSACRGAATAPVPGAGRRPIASRSQRDARWRCGLRRTASPFRKNLKSQGGKRMAKLVAHMRLIAGALALAFIVAVSAPVSAQIVNPTADAVKEQQLLDQLKVIQGRVTIPDEKSGMLVHPA